MCVLAKFPIIIPIMLDTCYAENYASIIDNGLKMRIKTADLHH